MPCCAPARPTIESASNRPSPTASSRRRRPAARPRRTDETDQAARKPYRPSTPPAYPKAAMAPTVDQWEQGEAMKTRPSVAAVELWGTRPCALSTTLQPSCRCVARSAVDWIRERIGDQATIGIECVAAAAEERIVAERLLGREIGRFEIERAVGAQRGNAIAGLTARFQRGIGAIGTDFGHGFDLL